MTENPATYPDPDELLPQSGEMNLLDELIEFTGENTSCRITVGSDHIFSRNGVVPAWLAIEFMGQCSFYHFQLQRHDSGKPGVNGLFLGGRNITVNNERLQPDTYVVHAEVFGGNNRYYAARSHIHPEGQPSNIMISGRLNALMLDRDESLLEQHAEQFT